MKSKYFTPELARFLFDKGLLTIAERRVKKHLSKQVIALIIKYPYRSLEFAFRWAYTPEEGEFWQKIDKEYNK